MTTLKGSLEAFALPDVFRLLAHNRVTGALKVVRESGDGVIYFRGGEVYYAFSSLTREFLGQRLVNAKLITQGQLLRALDEQKKSGEKRLGDLLVEQGYLSKDLLDTFLKEQIQDAIFHLLQWDRGEFDFEDGASSPQEVGLSVSVENLIMESSRRLEEWEVIQRKIPSLDVVVRMAPTPPDNQMEINIKPEEWTLLVLADGRRSVRDIAAAAERSEFDACRILYGLVTAGLLDVASGTMSPDAEAPSQAPPRLATPARPVPPPATEPYEPAQPPREAAAPDGQEVAAEVPSADEEVQVREVATEAAPAPAPLPPPPPEPAEPAADEEPAPEAEPVLDEESIAAPAAEVVLEEEPAPRRPIEDAQVIVPGSPKPEKAAVPAGAMKGQDESPHGDPTVSKELLMRLIAGVRNL